jgi:hypothetical protein
MIFLETTGYGYSKRLCRDIVNWFVCKYLSEHNLDIQVLHRSLKSDGMVGYCDIAGETDKPTEFLIEIDTHLDKETYTRVLIHELYHVMQFVKEELKIKSCKKYFRGECMDDLEYWQQSHEIFAYWYEKILYQEYLKDKNLTHP